MEAFFLSFVVFYLRPSSCEPRSSMLTASVGFSCSDNIEERKRKWKRPKEGSKEKLHFSNFCYPSQASVFFDMKLSRIMSILKFHKIHSLLIFYHGDKFHSISMNIIKWYVNFRLFWTQIYRRFLWNRGIFY